LQNKIDDVIVAYIISLL